MSKIFSRSYILVYLIGLVTVLTNLLKQKSFLPDGSTHLLITGGILFLSANLVRSLRLWITLANSKNKIGDLFLLQNLTSVFSWMTNVWIGEFFRLWFYHSKWNRQGPEMLIAVPFIRIFDLFCMLLLMLYIGNNSSTYSDNTLVLFGVGCLFVAFLFIIFQRIATLASNFLIKYVHHKSSLTWLTIIRGLIKTFSKMKLGKPENFFTIFSLSIFIWILEWLSLSILLSYAGNQYYNATQLMMFNIFSKTLSEGQLGSSGLYLFLTYFTIFAAAAGSIYIEFFQKREK